MKTLTIKQPWASLIAEGIKDVENRTWQNHYRGTILVHSSAAPCRVKPCELLTENQLKACVKKGIVSQDGQDWKIDLPTSSILCAVDIVDCVKNAVDRSVWAEPEVWNNFLANVRKFKQPVRGVKGSLSLWNWDLDEGRLKEINS